MKPDGPESPGARPAEGLSLAGLLTREERAALAREFRRDVLERFVRDALAAEKEGRLDKPQRRTLSRHFRALGRREKQEALDALRRQGGAELVRFSRMALNAHFEDAVVGLKSLSVFMREARACLKNRTPSRLEERDLVREFKKLSDSDQEQAIVQVARLHEDFSRRLEKLRPRHASVTILG